MDQYKSFVTQDFGFATHQDLGRARYTGALDVFKHAGGLDQCVAGIMKWAPTGIDTSAFTGVADAVNSVIAGLRVDTGFVSNLDALSNLGPGALILRNYDFGLTGIAKTLQGFDSRLLDLPERLSPRNLRDTDLHGRDLYPIMRDEGIPFCLVPDPQTRQLLYEATDANERRALLVDRAQPILAACNDVVGLCVETELAVLGNLRPHPSPTIGPVESTEGCRHPAHSWHGLSTCT